MFLKCVLVVALLLANLLISACYPFLPDLSVSRPLYGDGRSVAPVYIPFEQSNTKKKAPAPGWTTFTKSSGMLGNDNVQTISQDEKGNLWIGTRNGVSCFDGNEWKIYYVDDGLSNNTVYSISTDDSGDVWFGTDTGASSFNGQHWFSYTVKDGLIGDVVQVIFKDNKGNLWFSTNSGLRNNRRCPAYYGVIRFDGSSWVNYTTQSTLGGLPSDTVMAINQDKDGNLWFGTTFGVSRYDGKIWRTFTVVDGLADNYVFAIDQDNKGNLWFGTPGKGVTRFDGERWQTFTKKDGLVGNYVISILADNQGNVWFGTEGGVSCFDGTNWRTFTEQDGLADTQVHCIFQDAKGNMWFGTYTDGISRFEAK